MKLELKCGVHSDVLLSRRLILNTENRTLIFECDAQGLWNSLTVLAAIDDPSKVVWGTKTVEGPRPSNRAPFDVVGDLGSDLFNTVIEEIQCLESTLSVFMPLRSINWRYPTFQVLFEEGDERTLGHLGTVHVDRQKPAPTMVAEKIFVSVVGLALNSRSLVVAESFWREGETEWIAGKFINAFFNYYFVLEGFHGNRKTKNYQIEQEMLKSPALKSVIDKFNQGQHPIEHLKQLARLLKITDAIPTAQQLIGLLVSTRGNLHHFQNNTNREQGSPLVHDRYEAVAYLARSLAHGSLLEVATKIPPVAFGRRGT